MQIADHLNMHPQDAWELYQSTVEGVPSPAEHRPDLAVSLCDGVDVRHEFDPGQQFRPRRPADRPLPATTTPTVLRLPEAAVLLRTDIWTAVTPPGETTPGTEPGAVAVNWSSVASNLPEIDDVRQAPAARRTQVPPLQPADREPTPSTGPNRGTTPGKPVSRRTAAGRPERTADVTFEDLSTLYTANQTLIASLGALAGVAVLLVTTNRLRAMKEHRATLLVATILTTLAAALATMVSASGMWKFFTDILGETTLRIAFFAFIEIALFASALLARSRLLRDPQTGTTGIDGIAVWVLAALTATLSALDSDSFREVCLRLVAPLVAAWMWERALAAERHVRLGNTTRRINWALTPERVFVWLRLAEASDRDVSEVDRARRRAKLGRARLLLHLLQSRNAFAWRVRRAHRKVVKQAMQAAEHIGLADFPDATNERQAIQMYMATLYEFVDATSPQAVAHLNAWQHDTGSTRRSTDVAVPAVAHDPHHAHDDRATGTTNGAEEAKVLTSSLTGQATRDDTDHVTTHPGRPEQANGRHVLTGTAISEPTAHEPGNDPQSMGRRHKPAPAAFGQRLDLDGPPFQAGGPPASQRGGTDELTDDEPTGDDRSDNKNDNDGYESHGDDAAHVSAVAAMRRFWDSETAQGRIPTGAELSRAARVPPSTGLGRRKRREWEAELHDNLTTAAAAGSRSL